MTDREKLLAMAEWLTWHRFSPKLRDGDCGCFYAAHLGTLGDEPSLEGRQALAQVVGVESFAEEVLYAAGWTGPECTADAAAACRIAADLVS